MLENSLIDQINLLKYHYIYYDFISKFPGNMMILKDFLNSIKIFYIKITIKGYKYVILINHICK